MTMKHFPTWAFFVILSAFLTAIWFRGGMIFGGGDVGLQTYNPPRVLEIAKYIWWEATGPGSPVPQGLTAVSFNFIFSFLKLVGFSPFLMQASLFFLILTFSGWGMYRLIIFLLEAKYRSFALLGGLFYLFNPYAMVSVWHRFVHSTFFFMAALPFMIIFWLKWIRFQKPSALLIFSVITLLSLYAFGTLAYVLTLWVVLLMLTVCETLFPWRNFKFALKIFLRFIVALLFWIVVNGWWMVPVFTISPALLSAQHSNAETISTMINLGYQTVIPYSLQMVNPFYMFYQLDFGNAYLGLIRIFPWIFVAFILIGFIRALTEKGIAYLSVIFMAVFLLSKGVASPFGYPFIFGVDRFFFLGVLRNPFEKIGILLPLFGTILFVVGLTNATYFLKGRFGKLPALSLMMLALILIFSFSYPMFKGEIFGKFDKPEFVEVPASYQEADEFIKNDDKDKNKNPGKILHLPLTRRESISYNWPAGYNGLESSQLFFTGLPSIAHGFNVSRVDNSMEALYFAFHNPDLINEKVLKIFLKDFNIRYVILHKDVKWQGSDVFDPVLTESYLNKISFLTPLKQFGDLIVYKISDENFGPKITLAGDFKWVVPPNSSSSMPWILDSEKTIITPTQSQQIPDFGQNPAYVFPKSSFVFNQASSSASLDELIRIKPALKQNGELYAENLVDLIIDSNRKLVQKDIQSYEKDIRKIFSSALADYRLTVYVKDSYLSALFQDHLDVLNALGEQEVMTFLKEQLSQNNLMPKYKNEADFTERSIQRFEIGEGGEWEILYANLPPLKLTVDGEDLKMGSKVNLPKGEHEISFPTLYGDAVLIDMLQLQNNYLEVPLKPVLGDNVYRVSFQAKIETGSGFYFQLLQDGEKIEQFVNQSPGAGWVDYNFILPLTKSAVSEASIRFLTPAVRNFKLERRLQGDVILKKAANAPETSGDLAVLQIDQKSPVFYQGRIHLDKSAVLVFGETYHPGWELTLLDYGQKLTPSTHMLANLYANAWFIERGGDFDFSIYFKPQRIVNAGALVAMFGYIGLAGLSLITKKKA